MLSQSQSAEPGSHERTPANAADERDPELVEIFLEEGFDIIDSAGAALQRWMADTDNSLELESLQRDLHTLKGGARMAEISAIGDLAHELEFLYEGLGNGRLRASPALFGLLQDCHDRLEQMLEALRERRALPDGQALIELIQRFRANPDEQLSMPTSVHLQPASEEEPLVEADSDILDIFLEEAEDLLESIEAAIGRMSGGSEDGEALDDLLRLLHTLKGGARLAGQKRLGNISHDLEQHLTEARQQGQPWPESLLVDLQSAYEGLQGELQQLRARLDEQRRAATCRGCREWPPSRCAASLPSRLSPLAVPRWPLARLPRCCPLSSRPARQPRKPWPVVRRRSWSRCPRSCSKAWSTWRGKPRFSVAVSSSR